jgi:hypothetical protein
VNNIDNIRNGNEDKNNNRVIGFITIIITYVVVKIIHRYAGFQYDISREGIINVKLLIDIFSWIVVYALVYTLLKKILPQKDM